MQNNHQRDALDFSSSYQREVQLWRLESAAKDDRTAVEDGRWSTIT